MVRVEDVKEGVALRFSTPDGSPDLVGCVQRVDDGYVYLCNQRWPLDVVARESAIIPRPSPEHHWDGATDSWFLPGETQPTPAPAIVMSHARHA